MKSTLVQAGVLMACVASVAAEAMAEADARPSTLRKREGFMDTLQVFNRKRNAHACIMSIVFIVLFPLGAISMHLPFKGIVRSVVLRIHAPIQVLGLVMMIGGMALGIDIAKNDLDYITPVHAHVVIGLLTTSLVILLQPALGVLQHLHYRKTQQKGAIAAVHRWNGRLVIVLGWVNAILGFQLFGWEFVSQGSMIREFVLMGALGAIWFTLVGVDAYRHRFLKKENMGEFGPQWEKGLVFRTQHDEKPVAMGRMESSGSEEVAK